MRLFSCTFTRWIVVALLLGITALMMKLELGGVSDFNQSFPWRRSPPGFGEARSFSPQDKSFPEAQFEGLGVV